MATAGALRAEPDPKDRVPLRDLPRRLTDCGYSDFLATFVRLGCPMERMSAGRALSPSQLRPVLDLFLLGGEVLIEELPRPVQEILPTLDHLAIVSCGAGVVQSTGLSLVSVLGRWVFSQQLQPSPSVYFGDDTLALLHRLTPSSGCTVLDLCSGPGTQALHCAGFAREVVAIEINPAAHAVACLNVELNGLAQRVRPLIGDLYDPVGGRQFDLIIANPPLIPIPRELPFPFVADGGEDGLEITRRIIRGTPQHLTDTGSAQIIGTSLSDGILPAVLDVLRTDMPTGLDALVTVTAHVAFSPGDWQFEMIAATAKPPIDRERAREMLRDFLAGQKATHLAYFHLRLRRGDGKITMMDLSNDVGRSALWYA